jgi:prolyl oligopeptidase
MKDPKVIAWFKQQAELTDATMKKVSGRDELIAEWKKLDALQPPTYYSPTEAGGRYFFQKRVPGEKVSRVFYRENLSGEDKLLFDPMTFIPGKTLSVESIVPSYDGKKLIIAYAEEGAEISTIKVMNVDSKKLLPDTITATAGAGNWSFDNNSFFYMWINSTDNMDPNSRLNPKYKRHILGTDVKNDIDYFSNASYPELKIDEKSYPFVFLSEFKKEYVFAGQGTVQPELTIYYAPIAEFNSPQIKWKTLTTEKDEIVRGFEIFDGKMYAITHKDAKNYRLVATDLKNPNWNNAEVIAEEKTTTLEYLTRSKDFLILTYSDGVTNFAFKYDPKNKITVEIKLPFAGSTYFENLDKKTNNFLVYMTSWNKPITQFLYNADTGTFSESPFNKAPKFPEVYKDLVSEEVEVKGHDGVMIPLSIIYKKGIKKDGSNVCLMESYGAYGSSMSAYFSIRLNSLAVKGVVIAIPHVRGGSEKGQEWYKAGFKTTKPNTWKDFISCAEYMIAQGYTSKEKLAGTGTSAGGVLITRAITERPDLFAAAVCNVGVANAMRAEFSANGPVNTPEFGTVSDEVECKALYQMDGLQHVKDRVKYPAIMCVAGWNDSRVAPWEPGKFAAATQNASTSGKPLLLKVNYDNGHFTEDKQVTWANFADQYSFMMWQSGHPEFQLKK